MSTQTAELEAQKALAEIYYILNGTEPTDTEADTAIRKALELTAATLERTSNMLTAQRAGLESLRKSLPTPASPVPFPPQKPRA